MKWFVIFSLLVSSLSFAADPNIREIKPQTNNPNYVILGAEGVAILTAGYVALRKTELDNSIAENKTELKHIEDDLKKVQTRPFEIPENATPEELLRQHQLYGEGKTQGLKNLNYRLRTTKREGGKLRGAKMGIIGLGVISATDILLNAASSSEIDSDDINQISPSIVSVENVGNQ